MKILLDEIKDYAKLLKDVPYNPIGNRSTLFFEIDAGHTIETGDFVMETKVQNSGSSSMVKPGLALFKELDDKGREYTVVRLVYAQIDYSPKFDLGLYLDITKGKISKSARSKLTEIDCILVKHDYVIGEFEL